MVDKKKLICPSIPHLYDHLFPSVSDEDFKHFHGVDRRLYAKMINILGRDPTDSMKVIAFLQWLEGVAKQSSFLKKLYDIPNPLLNEVVEEALTCLKCAEVVNFTESGSREIFWIPNLLKRKFTLTYIRENRESIIHGVTDLLRRVCLRAFDDIVQQPNYFKPSGSLVPNVFESMNKLDHERGGSSSVNRNPYHHVPTGGFVESMIPNENKIEEIGSLNSSRMMSIISPSHFVGGTSSNIEEIGMGVNRMVAMNNVPAAAGGGMVLGLPYVVPNQMVQYMPPIIRGSAMNLLPATPYGLYSHASSSGSGVFHPQMRLRPRTNYHPDLSDAQAPPDLADLFKNNINFNVVVNKEDKEVPPDDRTVFLTFSKGYPITQTEVMEFFTRKFGEDVVGVYMQEVADDEQALYARLVTRSPAALEAIVDGGRAKYNINGKHVWARKYVKKASPKIQFVGQTSSSD